MCAAPFTLESVTADQQPTLVTLIGEYYAYDGLEFDATKVHQALEILRADPQLGTAWLVIAAGHVAGYAIVSYSFGVESGGRDAIVDELYLRSPYRGQGWGMAILQRIEAYCRAQGCQVLYLFVECHNTQAPAVYRKLNFEAADRLIFSKDLGHVIN